MINIKYFFYCCSFLLIFYGGVVLSEEKCIFLTSCYGIDIWGNVERSKNIIGKETEKYSGEKISKSPLSNDTTTKWSVNLGFEKAKLGSLPFLKRIPIVHENKIFTKLEFDAYLTYGSDFKYNNLDGSKNTLNTDRATKETSFNRTFALRFRVPIF